MTRISCFDIGLVVCSGYLSAISNASCSTIDSFQKCRLDVGMSWRKTFVGGLTRDVGAKEASKPGTVSARPEADGESVKPAFYPRAA